MNMFPNTLFGTSFATWDKLSKIIRNQYNCSVEEYVAEYETKQSLVKLEAQYLHDYKSLASRLKGIK